MTNLVFKLLKSLGTITLNSAHALFSIAYVIGYDCRFSTVCTSTI